MFSLRLGDKVPQKRTLEYRDTTRRQCAASVKIKLANGTWHDCRTADMSKTGAKIMIGTRPVMLGRTFEVWLAEGVRPARLVWRSKDAIGVRFL